MFVSMQYYQTFTGLPNTQGRIDGLMADFSGLEKVEEIVNKVLQRLTLSEQAQANARFVKNGTWTMQTFDGWFSEFVRAELGKTLGIIRNKAVEKARAAGAGDASSAMLRRMYKGEYRGAVHDLGNKRRLSSKERIVPEPSGGESGIRRHRTVSDRTEKIRKYYGPDRSFILRFLDGGTDVRTAKSQGAVGRGSMSTHGARGNIAPRSFFHSLSSDMEQAAQQLGFTLVNNVEKFIEQKFKETE